MTRAVLLFFVSAAFAQEPAWQSMFDGQSLKGWKETPFTSKGVVKVQDGCIVIGKGYMTGVTYTGTLPKTNYEVRMEAQRAEGHDFFAGITFPGLPGDPLCGRSVVGDLDVAGVRAAGDPVRRPLRPRRARQPGRLGRGWNAGPATRSATSAVLHARCAAVWSENDRCSDERSFVR